MKELVARSDGRRGLSMRGRREGENRNHEFGLGSGMWVRGVFGQYGRVKDWFYTGGKRRQIRERDA